MLYNTRISAQYFMMDTGDLTIKLTLNYYETLCFTDTIFPHVSTYSKLEAALFEWFSLIVLDFSVDAVMLYDQRDAQMDAETLSTTKRKSFENFLSLSFTFFHPFSHPAIKSSPRCDTVNTLTTFFPRINAGDVDNQNNQVAISREREL